MPVRSIRCPRKHSSIAHVGTLGMLLLLAITLFPIMPVSAAPLNQASGVDIKILPINAARFIAGQRFDLRVEISGAIADNTDPNVISLTVNGQPAAAFFGKAPEGSNASPRSAELTLRQVAFTRPGSYTIAARAGSASKTVTYEVLRTRAQGRPAKNVILFIGDGMSWEMLTMARIVSKGLTAGKFNGKLEMDTMQAVGYTSTSGYDSLVTDSANSMSAYTTGQKGVVNSMGVYEDNTSNPNDDPRVENINELLKRTRNMAVGIVTTSNIQDATPAAVFAHTRRRSEFQYITDQLLDDPLHRPEVVMGGGLASFLPKSATGSRRTDERDVVQEFKNNGYAYVTNRAEMNAAGTPQRLLGLFNTGDMNVYVDREQIRDPQVLKQYPDQPTLYEMTQKAIDVLSNTPAGAQNGFFLMVEGASIDKQLHPLDWERAAGDTIEFDRALGVAKRFAGQRNDTLVIATADHGHSVSTYGTYTTAQGPANREAVGIYNESTFPTYVDTNGDGLPDNWDPSQKLAVGFGNRPDYRDDFFFNPRPLSPTIQDPNAPQGTERFIPNPERDPNGILLTGNLPPESSTEVHSADDVPLFASGPGATYFQGYHDNTDLFFGMMSALNVDATRNASRASTNGIALGALASVVLIGAGGALRRRWTQRVVTVVRKTRRVGRAVTAAVHSFRSTISDA